MAPRVLISDALSPAAVQIFKDRGIEVDFQPTLGKDKDKLAELIGDFDGLAIRSATKVTPKILEKAKNLKVIGRAGIGVDNVDIPAATARGIIVMNTPFGNSITTAEHAISLMLALARQIPEADTSTRAGKWEKNKFMGVEIFGKTLGVIGCGNIGSIVADRAIGLKMKVIAYDPFLSQERATRARRREGRARRAVQARRFHHAAHPAHRQDPQHHRRRRAQEDEKGRAHHQLRARRAGRRGGDRRGAQVRSGGGRRLRRVRRPSRPRKARCSACPTSSARRISAPPPREAQENVALQVAEQMADYLLRGAISNAVNFPSISAEEAPRLKPFVALAEKLGSFAGQLTENPIKEVQITYEGAVAQMNIKALTSAVLVGPAAADAGRRQRGVGAAGGARARHGGRGDHARGGRRLREPDHRQYRDRKADALGLRHRVRRRPPAHRQHQGHPHGRRVRPLDDLHHQSRQARLHRPLLLHAWARPASTSPPFTSAARRPAATPSR